MLEMKVKTLFFDRAKIARAVDLAKRESLAKAGGFVRTTAKRSIRNRKGTSLPGKPPHSHVGLLRRFIYFAYDPDSESVVVGPVKITRPTNAPHALEFGGTTVVKRKHRKRKVRIKARPFMGPALQKQRAQLPRVWANSVR